jgi:hypothetical protein
MQPKSLLCLALMLAVVSCGDADNSGGGGRGGESGGVTTVATLSCEDVCVEVAEADCGGGKTEAECKEACAAYDDYIFCLTR